MVTSKANHTLGLIKKSFINISNETFLRLYKTLVRPQIEYGNVIWGPFFFSLDQDKIEQIQRKATKLVPYKTSYILSVIRSTWLTITKIQMIARGHDYSLQHLPPQL